MTDTLLIDTHVHLYRSPAAAAQDKESYTIWEYGDGGRPAYSPSLGSPEELVRSMSASGVSRVVVLNLFIAEWETRRFETGLPRDMPAAERTRNIEAFKGQLFDALRDFNLWGCRVAKENPAITPFVSVDLNVAGPEESAALFRELVEDHGARGLKLHSAIHRHGMDDERLWPLFRLCRDYDLPVLGHAGLDPDGAGYAEPKAFARVLEEFPELRLILAHMGGGGWRQTAALAKRFPNVWLDCAEIIEWSDASLAPSQCELAALIREVGVHRVLMGSDYPWYDLDRTVSRVRELPLLSLEEKELILGRNAKRLLDGSDA
ncbi:MAG: amidohydrolase family protein [Parvibaculaceae bacterium]